VVVVHRVSVASSQAVTQEHIFPWLGNTLRLLCVFRCHKVLAERQPPYIDQALTYLWWLSLWQGFRWDPAPVLRRHPILGAHHHEYSCGLPNPLGRGSWRSSGRGPTGPRAPNPPSQGLPATGTRFTNEQAALQPSPLPLLAFLSFLPRMSASSSVSRSGTKFLCLHPTSRSWMGCTSAVQGSSSRSCWGFPPERDRPPQNDFCAGH